MTTAWDKASRALLWTAFLTCLVFCLQGRPPAHAQDGTSSANTVQGLYLKEAINENNMAQMRAESNANTASISAQDVRIRELEKSFSSMDAQMKIYGPFLIALMGGNIFITWKKKKAEE